MAEIIDTRIEPERAIESLRGSFGRRTGRDPDGDRIRPCRRCHDPDAISRIYEMKGRPRFNPLICHVCDLAMAEAHVTFDPVSRRLAEAFWPGPSR